MAETQGDLEELNTTQLERSDRKDLSHSRGWSPKPKKVEKHHMRMGWSTESKAEFTSNKARRVT